MSSSGVAKIDVSTIAAVRKRASRAARTAKAVSVLMAFQLGGLLQDAGIPVLAPIAGLLLVFLVWWGARKLISGSKVAARALGLGCVLAFGCFAVPTFLLLTALFTAPHFCNSLDAATPETTGIAAGSALYPLALLSLAWVLSGVIAVLRYPGTSSQGLKQMGPLRAVPWEQLVSKTRKPPIFANKHKWVAYGWATTSGALGYVGLAVIVIFIASVPRSGCALISAVNSGDLVLYGRAAGDLLAPPTMLILVWLPIILLYRRARRHAMVRASDLISLHRGGFVLYLRSFIDDKLRMRARAANGRIWPEMLNKISFEQVISDHLWHYADVLAIGKSADAEGHPADKLAPLGAARDYFPDSAWRETVMRWMNDAVLICSIAGMSQSYLWEIAAAAEYNHLSKLILLFPPVPPIDLERRWRALSEAVPGLPGLDLTDLIHARAIVFQRDHVLLTEGRLQDDWTFETAIDTAAHIILGDHVVNHFAGDVG